MSIFQKTDMTAEQLDNYVRQYGDDRCPVCTKKGCTFCADIEQRELQQINANNNRGDRDGSIGRQ